MKKILLIVVLLLLVAAGVIGGLAAFGLGPFPQLIAMLAPAKAEKSAKEAPPAAAAAKERTFDLGTFIIPLIDKRNIGRQVGMDLAIVVSDAEANRVSAEMPRLQNALLVDLYDYIPQHTDTHSAAERDIIHDHLVKVAGRVFGDGAVRNVVIKSLYDR